MKNINFSIKNLKMKNLKMKKQIVFLALLSLLSCKKNEEKNDEPGIMDAVEGIQNLEKAGDAMKDFEKKAEELKKMKPISNEIFKQVLTEELGGLKRLRYTAGDATAMGLSSGEAIYGDDNATTIKLSIFDGAGESGSAIIAMSNLSLSMDSESIQGTTTKKTEEINGIKCLTENDTNTESNRSKITYIYKERFQIDLEGNKINLDDLKSFMSKIDFSKLQ